MGEKMVKGTGEEDDVASSSERTRVELTYAGGSAGEGVEDCRH